MTPPARATIRRMVGTTVVVGVAVQLLLGATPAAAERTGGATSNVVGRGDIVTSILAAVTNSGGRTSPRPPTGCRWVTFDDAQLEFLVAVASGTDGRVERRAVLDALLAQVGHPDFATSDLQGEICDGAPTGFRLVPRSASGDVRTELARAMITRLPPPQVVVSPPEGAPVPVGEPVFVSVTAPAWQPIASELAVDGTLAEVRARPIGMRTFSGEPGTSFRSCEGPGRPYDDRDPTPPALQATAPAACASSFTAATRSSSGRAIPFRPPVWIGTVSVLWSAEWRVDGGPWRSLGVIERTRLVERRVVEVTSALEGRSRAAR